MTFEDEFPSLCGETSWIDVSAFKEPLANIYADIIMKLKVAIEEKVSQHCLDKEVVKKAIEEELMAVTNKELFKKALFERLGL